MIGYEYLPCEILGKPCTSYQECVRESRDTFACHPQTTLAQLGTFFSEGASSDTPGWIWGVVGCVVLLIGVGIYFLYSKSEACSTFSLLHRNVSLSPDLCSRYL